MKDKVNNSLSIIFSEINSIRDIVYKEIKNRHMDTTNDIREAINDTNIYNIFKDFEIYGRQFDVMKIIRCIEDYIYYDIEYFVAKDQWDE